MIKRLWTSMASIRLTLWLLCLLTVNLFIGSIYTKFMPVFGKLNAQLFPSWIMQHNGVQNWWIFTLFGLLFLLGVNTAACTLQRLTWLWQRRSQYRRAIFMLLLAPSIMHFCFLFIIGGHALTEFTGSKQRLPAVVGEQVTVNDLQVTLLERHYEYWREPLLLGAMKQCTATLELKHGADVEQRQIAILEPIYWQGYTLHLGMAGKPGVDVLPALQITVKKDPGLLLILIGNTILCLLMLWYFPQIRKVRNGGPKS